MPVKKEKRLHIGFQIDPSDYARLRRLAKQEHQTVSGLLRKLVAAMLESIDA